MRYIAFFVAVLCIASQAHAQALTKLQMQQIGTKLLSCWKPDAQGFALLNDPTVTVDIDYYSTGVAKNVRLAPESEKRFKLNQDYQKHAMSALHAAISCELKSLELPPETYNQWKQITYTFKLAEWRRAGNVSTGEDGLSHSMGVLPVQ